MNITTDNKATLKRTYNYIKELVAQPNLGKKISMKHLHELKETKVREREVVRARVEERTKNRLATKIADAVHNSIITSTKKTDMAFKKRAFVIVSTLNHFGKHIKAPIMDDKIKQFKKVLHKMYYQNMSKIEATDNNTYLFDSRVRLTNMVNEDTFFKWTGRYRLEPGGGKTLYKKWIKDAMDALQKFIESYDNLKDLKLEFDFATVPKGAGTKATESRAKQAIYSKKSVNVINNNDDSCFWHALAVALSKKKDDKTYRTMKDGGKKRTQLAKELCEQCNMKWNKAVDITEIKMVEEVLQLNIYVMDIENIPILRSNINIYDNLLYKSPYNQYYEQCWLLLDNEHYNVINNIKGMMACDYFCEKCLSFFASNKKASDEHTCKPCNTEDEEVDVNKNANKFYKDAAHYLHQGVCKGSQHELDMKLAESEEIQDDAIRAKMQEKIKTNHNFPTYIIYDFETFLHTNIHKPNLCIAKKIQANINSKYQKCILETREFYGENARNDFCDWLFQKDNSYCTVMAHNQAGYDGKFILSWMLEHQMGIGQYIRQGSRITYMTTTKYHLRFIDTLSFFLCRLSDLSETYGIETEKGHFPHKFNTLSNQTYVGEIPDEIEFGARNMKPDDYIKFKKWYDEAKKEVWDFKEEFIKYCKTNMTSEDYDKFNSWYAKNDKKVWNFKEGFFTYSKLNMTPLDYDNLKKWYDSAEKEVWNFKHEFIKYCQADVDLLGEAVLKFRMIFKGMLDVDPFRYVTLPSLCKDIYINKFMPENTIVGNASNKPVSRVSKEWLTYLDDKDIIPEVPIKLFVENATEYYKPGYRTFTVDGLNKNKKLVSEFNGCYWHGCPKCYPKLTKTFEKTNERQQLLEKNGYKVNVMWECEWNALKETLPNKVEIESEARAQNINVRDGLSGGRTEVFKKYFKCNAHQRIYYYDVTSLYPTVNALDPYAIGFKKYVKITPDDILSGKFFGMVKCDISPPKDIYVPLLHDSSDNKLMFHLQDMKEKTYTSVELKKSLEHGYTITKIHAALEYKKQDGIMRAYVAEFIQMKIKNSGLMNQEECDKVNKYHKDLGFEFIIKPEDCMKNKGLRQVAKICLNSLWGKFGQRSNLDTFTFTKTYESFISKLCNAKLNVKTWDIIGEDCIEMRFNEDEDKNIEADFISDITAVFTTANARMRLYDMLSWLDPSQVLYCDTDSCFFVVDDENPKHKTVNNDDPTLPKSVKFGNGLGQWDDELKGSFITEFVASGAKSYAYKKADGEIKIAQKGITLDCNNSDIFTFENLKKMVLDDSSITSHERYQFKWEKKNIITTYMTRSVQSTVDSKRIVEGNDTLPYGIDKKAYRRKQCRDELNK